uniref:Uncharacterized protein n=1 Tax=viral metagenome TaxID=1070528 RepID=A0A6C0KNG0_9ZZZZ
MTIQFVIIPSSQNFQKDAMIVKYKIESSIQVDSLIDNEFDKNIQARINKWKSQNYDIILINDNYNESNNICFSFCEKGSRFKNMQLQEFIDIVESYENDDKDGDLEEEVNENNIGAANCNIM